MTKICMVSKWHPMQAKDIKEADVAAEAASGQMVTAELSDSPDLKVISTVETYKDLFIRYFKHRFLTFSRLHYQL